MMEKAAMLYLTMDYPNHPRRTPANPEDPGLPEPGFIRRWLIARALRRELKLTIFRLQRTAPHLLDDVGLSNLDPEALPRLRQHYKGADPVPTAQTFSVAAE